MKFVNYKTCLTSWYFFILANFVFGPITTNAQSTSYEDVHLDKIPPRIIRACCTFGYDMKLWGVPFISIDQVISLDKLGEHHYMGKKSEGIGTIYTQNGGFIDIAHVRDQIDWTRYLHAAILNSRGKGEVILPLRNEAGRKTLYLNVPLEFSNSDCILLAGKITYDFSLWHEIATWYGASTVPLISEKFSSFSVEDVYSNLLGIHIGMKTLHSKLPFNQAATINIRLALDSLAVVKTVKETYNAYDAIHNKWYTSNKRIPSKKITLKRDTDILMKSRPWIVPNGISKQDNPFALEVPFFSTEDTILTNFYQFTIALNRKVPVKDIFPCKESRVINQDDFGVLLDAINNEIQRMDQNIRVEKK